MVIDGTWFKKKENCALVYWDPVLKRVQWWRYTTGERTFEVAEDLRKLKKAGFVCSSATGDGATGIIGGVRVEYPDIPYQRCVTHVQRDARGFVTQNPKTEAGKELSPLIPRLSEINTYEEKDCWVENFESWCNRWEDFLKEKTCPDGDKHWWYTHKQLRRARSLIRGAITNLFHYLDDPSIPKTSNGLEGRFSSFKQHYKQHRGLSKKRREGYIAWYLTVVVNGDLPTHGGY